MPRLRLNRQPRQRHEAEQRAHQREAQRHPLMRRRRGDDDQHFGEEHPERRKAHQSGERAEEQPSAGVVPEAVELADRRRPALVLHDPDRQEREGLAEGVVDDVIERREQRERRPDAERDRDQSGVFDRRVREQPLHVVLREHQDAAGEHRGAAEHEQHAIEEARFGRAGDELHAHDRVERAGHEQSREQRADRRRRFRVRVGQPRMHRHEPGLRAEPEQHQRQRQARERGRQGGAVRGESVPRERGRRRDVRVDSGAPEQQNADQRDADAEAADD